MTTPTVKGRFTMPEIIAVPFTAAQALGLLAYLADSYRGTTEPALGATVDGAHRTLAMAVLGAALMPELPLEAPAAAKAKGKPGRPAGSKNKPRQTEIQAAAREMDDHAEQARRDAGLPPPLGRAEVKP